MPSCFTNRKHGTEVIGAEAISIRTTNTHQVELMYLYICFYTDLGNNNSQGKRGYPFERLGTEELEVGNLGRTGEGKAM